MNLLVPVIVVLNYSISPGAGRLDINNYDVGGVSINLHEGAGALALQKVSVSVTTTQHSLKLLMMEEAGS